MFLTPHPLLAFRRLSPAKLFVYSETARLGHWDSSRPCGDAERAPGQEELVRGS